MHQWLAVLSTLLLLATTLEIGLYVYLTHTQGLSRRYSYTGPDHPETLPVPPSRPVAMFDHNTVHLQMTAAREWAAQAPGGGLVFLGPSRRPFMVAMMHQLRCLDIVRRAVLEGPSSNNTDLMRQTRHCMNYLRQMALCHTSTRLEWVTSVTPSGSVWQEDYVCRDWSTAYDTVKGNHADYARWSAARERFGGR
ncbi:hypothetical protein AURDEDRAFT_112273 [Auricularia subglabra TFB-10046 SS5]|nr:hypothetical protein AURDEDRAFT_112273 [Auricularia subglabra TFB-10046 SS5]